MRSVTSKADFISTSIYGLARGFSGQSLFDDRKREVVRFTGSEYSV
jgi:hypothetical protein